MLAGGSEQRIKLSRSVEDSGGILDFFTDHEQVTSMLDALPEKLVQTSKVLCSLLFDDGFSEEKFDVERKIILNELAEFADDPTVRVEELLMETLFKRHPIRRPVGGYPKTVKSLTLEQLRREHQTNYVPGNMVLVLAGNFSVDVQAKIFADLGSLDCPPKPQGQICEPEVCKPKSRVEVEKAGIAQTYLYLGARTVNSNHCDAPTMDLLATLLGGGTSSRLFTLLREKHAVTYDVTAGHCKGRDYGYLGVNCAVNNNKVAKATKLILREIKDLQTTLVAVDELERAKQIMLGGVLRAMDNPHDTLEIINYMEMQFGTQTALADYVKKIRAVSSRQLLDAANLYLSSDKLCNALLVPAKN